MTRYLIESLAEVLLYAAIILIPALLYRKPRNYWRDK